MTILAACLFALTQGDPSLDSRVASYAAQLREDATRDRARDRLVHLGKPALALLEKADVDPAILASIRQEVALNESLGAAYGPPHTFTFDGSEETLGVLLSRLEQVAGTPYQKNSLDLGQRLSIKLEDATYWEALDEICSKASIWCIPTNDPLYLTGGMASQKPRCFYGPIILVMDRVSQQRRVTFSAIESELTLLLSVAWEKSIAPLGPSGRYHLTTVVDDTGLSLLPDSTTATPSPRAGGSIRPAGQSLFLNGLRVPSPQAKKISRVEGTLELEFPSRIDDVRFELAPEGVTAAKEKAIEGAKVEMKNFVPQAAWGAAMTVSIRFTDPKEAAKFRIGNADVEFIMGADQKRYGWVGSASFAEGVYTFVVNWRNQGRSELPKEVRIRVPRGGVIKNVPFCFRDVELK
jgi:hypothetical protein